jgi:hypothetical protein
MSVEVDMNNTIDIQKVSGAFLKASDEQVNKISAKCVELQEKEKEITIIEEQLKKAKKDALFLSEETIPNLLTEAGIKSLENNSILWCENIQRSSGRSFSMASN